MAKSGITNPTLLKQFKHHESGFTVTGIDADGKPNRKSWQLRLKNPGNGAKYKCRKRQEGEGCSYDALLLGGRLSDFPLVAQKNQQHLSTVKSDKELWVLMTAFDNLPIVITEGAKKAACGLENGYITLSIPGCTMGLKPESTELVDTLRAFCGKDRPVTLIPDSDFRVNPDVYRAWRKLAKVLEDRGCKVRVGTWEATDIPTREKLTIKDVKGMDDFIVNGGDFDKVIKTAMTIAQWEKQFPEPKAKGKTDQRKGSGSAKLSPIEKAQLAINGLGVHLRFNELSKEIESSPGEGVDGDALWVRGCADSDLYTSVDTFYRVLGIEAKKDSYHPIQEYLKGCHEKYGDDVSVLNDIARRYLGTSDSLHQTFLVKWLIGAVARAMTPGCKMDTALVLHGSQGIGKSTFFNVLAGDWFTDSLDKLDSSNKDELLKAHQSWVIELAEIENAFSKTAISKIKQSMSATTDQIRPPYGRKTEKCKRGFVICGTTNQTQFLNDPTGSRRFWVISCNGRVNRELLTQERDQIWGAAYALWAKGEKWYLTEFEEEALAINNEGYESQDPWVEFLRDALLERGEQTTTVKDCFEHLDMPEPKSHNSKESRRIKDCLTHLGYQPEKFYRNGKQVRGWAIESLDKLNQNFGNSLSQLSQDAGTQSAQAFDNKTVQQNPLSHTVSSVSTNDDGDAEQDRQDSNKTVQDSLLSHPQTHTGQGVQDNKTVETVKPQTFNQNDLPFSRGDNVWVTTANGKREGTITNPPDRYGEWGVEFKNSKGEWMSHRFPSEGLSPREESDGYSVGDKVWVKDAQGNSREGVITHPKDEDGKWGLKINVGTSREEEWKKDIYYPSDELTPRLMS
ncbi:VapE domain-containing protein [Roseofilum capinflatum]|uniref:VapE family protein n=1 Tax=Roseofilum capinflatum BLCC-M114 TaxID=3022440 RepID=A0ABT7B2M8_9CYAN|nr:VapE domain-containing protein [Roseofilum capinflatum]MDJ1172909.1 VapE family protein [Roseofilum capinflatum BLCC-M114]